MELDKKFASAKIDETVLLHKRPYDFRRRDRLNAPSCASIMSNETAYFKNQFDRRERLNFDLGQDLHFKFYNRSSEDFHGQRLDSSKSCALVMNQSLLQESTKDHSKLQDLTSDDSCFKVPRSIVKKQEIP